MSFVEESFQLNVPPSLDLLPVTIERPIAILTTTTVVLPLKHRDVDVAVCTANRYALQ